MTKFLKLRAVAAAVGAFAALVATMPANAGVYALSQQRIYDFSIGIFDGTAPADTTVNSFQYTLNNSATVNGVNVSGGPSGATCNQGTCSTTNPVLDPLAANVGAVTVIENTFTPQGQLPAGATYARSDSVISADQLASLGLNFTDQNQIAEALLNVSGTAGAVTSLLSTSSLSLSFTVTGSTNNTLVLGFKADQLRALGVNVPTGSPLVSTAVNSTFALTDQTTFGQVSWNPNGAAGGCTVQGSFGGGSVVCGGELDPFSMNTTISSSTVPTNFSQANGGAGTNIFGITLSNLASGTYTFDLSTKNEVQIQQTVPEPGSLALIGLALAGMGFGMRSRQKKQA